VNQNSFSAWDVLGARHDEITRRIAAKVEPLAPLHFQPRCFVVFRDEDVSFEIAAKVNDVERRSSGDRGPNRILVEVERMSQRRDECRHMRVLHRL
jgi:hypothetical protein